MVENRGIDSIDSSGDLENNSRSSLHYFSRLAQFENFDAGDAIGLRKSFHCTSNTNVEP